MDERLGREADVHPRAQIEASHRQQVPARLALADANMKKSI
jgi:hypothetical protein